MGRSPRSPRGCAVGLCVSEACSAAAPTGAAAASARALAPRRVPSKWCPHSSGKTGADMSHETREPSRTRSPRNSSDPAPRRVEQAPAAVGLQRHPRSFFVLLARCLSSKTASRLNSEQREAEQIVRRVRRTSFSNDAKKGHRRTEDPHQVRLGRARVMPSATGRNLQDEKAPWERFGVTAMLLESVFHVHGVTDTMTTGELCDAVIKPSTENRRCWCARARARVRSREGVGEGFVCGRSLK